MHKERLQRECFNCGKTFAIRKKELEHRDALYCSRDCFHFQQNYFKRFGRVPSHLKIYELAELLGCAYSTAVQIAQRYNIPVKKTSSRVEDMVYDFLTKHGVKDIEREFRLKGKT